MVVLRGPVVLVEVVGVVRRQQRLALLVVGVHRREDRDGVEVRAARDGERLRQVLVERLDGALRLVQVLERRAPVHVERRLAVVLLLAVGGLVEVLHRDIDVALGAVLAVVALRLVVELGEEPVVPVPVDGLDVDLVGVAVGDSAHRVRDHRPGFLVEARGPAHHERAANVVMLGVALVGRGVGLVGLVHRAGLGRPESRGGPAADARERDDRAGRRERRERGDARDARDRARGDDLRGAAPAGLGLAAGGEEGRVLGAVGAVGDGGGTHGVGGGCSAARRGWARRRDSGDGARSRDRRRHRAVVEYTSRRVR